MLVRAGTIVSKDITGVFQLGSVCLGWYCLHISQVLAHYVASVLVYQQHTTSCSNAYCDCLLFCLLGAGSTKQGFPAVCCCVVLWQGNCSPLCRLLMRSSEVSLCLLTVLLTGSSHIPQLAVLSQGTLSMGLQQFLCLYKTQDGIILHVWAFLEGTQHAETCPVVDAGSC